MLEQIMKPVADAGMKVITKGGAFLAKEGVKQGTKIAAVIVSHLIAIIVTMILTSNYKDKAFEELLKKHDKETAEKLTEQFKSEIDALKKEIAKLKLDKKEMIRRFKEGVENICRKYGIDPKVVLKK